MGLKKITEPIGKCFDTLKPSIKGIIMVIIGIVSTRIGIGSGRIAINLQFGLLSYFFLAISGIIIIELLPLDGDSKVESRKSSKKLFILFGIFYGIGVGISFYVGIIYYVGIFPTIVVIIIGILWLLLMVYANKSGKADTARILIITLTFATGIIYGATLNTNYLIPLFIFFFFISASFLQFSREIIKETIPNEEGADLTVAFICQVVASAFLILPLLVNIISFVTYLYAMIICLIFIGVAAVLTIKSKADAKYAKRTATLLRFGVFFELVAFLFAA